MDTFITDNKNQAPQKNSSLLNNVRKEHTKLQAIVNSFGSKVEGMIDKQRNEYVQAYGHHMRDVQKELHLLREKATAIANDRTRDEKIKKLDSDQKWYRNEAIRLDSETNILRKKLKSLTSNISEIERERDWLLTKLRDAKTKYHELQQLRSSKNTAGQFEEGLSLLSNDSSYTLELTNNNLAPLPMSTLQKKSNAEHFKARLENDFGVSRDHAMMDALSHMVSAPTGQHIQNRVNYNHTKQVKSTAKSKRTLAKLVAARAKHEALGDFFNQCALNCGKGYFASRAPRARGIEELTEIATNYLSSNNMEQTDFYDTFSSVHNGEGVKGSSEGNTVFHDLICDLVCCPETYLVISDIMSGVKTKNNADNAVSAPPSMDPATATGESNTRNMSNPHVNDDVIQFHNITTDDTGNNTKESYAYNRSDDMTKQAPGTDDTEPNAIHRIVVDDTPGPLAVDKDIYAYLNVNSERRHARKEFKKSGGMF